MKVLWCHSHLVWLVIEASIPTCSCVYEGKLFVTGINTTDALAAVLTEIIASTCKCLHNNIAKI